MSPNEENTGVVVPASDTPLVPAINAWKFYLEQEQHSPHTVKAFVADVRLMTRYFPPDYPIGHISTPDLNKFLDWVQAGQGKNTPCSPKSLARRITSVKAFFLWLHKKAGALLANPGERVLQKSVLSPVPEVLDQDEMDRALEAAALHRTGPKPDARPFTLLLLLLETGIKKSETLALSPNHIELDSPTGPFLFVRYASPQHRYKERKIPLSETWVQAYHEYTAQYAPPADQLFPWSQRRLEYLLEDTSKEAGLKKHISFAMCRWTCSLNDLRNGVEPETVRQKLGVTKVQWLELRAKLGTLDQTTPV